jgi:hypothetical protein
LDLIPHMTTEIAQTVLYLGSIFGGSLLGFVLYHTIGYYLQRQRLRRNCLKDLIAELKQDKVYPSEIQLESEAYRQIRREGCFFDLKENLQSDLRKLYSAINMNNDLLTYYRDLGGHFVKYQFEIESAEENPRRITTEILSTLRNKLATLKDEINREIDVVLPELEKLLKDPS